MTKLEKELKREIVIDDKPYVVTISPQGLKLTEKGRRKGQELSWKDLVSGDAALATALNASVGARPAPEADQSQLTTKSAYGRVARHETTLDGPGHTWADERPCPERLRPRPQPR